MLKFTDFLEQNINEIRQRERIFDYYFLPINIEKSSIYPKKKEYLINDLIKCVRYIVEEYQNIRLSNRPENVDFIERANLFTTSFSLKENVSKILYSLKAKNFLHEWKQENSIAYEFLINLSDVEKILNVKFKDRSLIYEKLYIKFDIIYKIIKKDNKFVGIMKPIKTKKEYLLIDLKESIVDIISLHISTK